MMQNEVGEESYLSDQKEVDLRDYFMVLRARKWVFILAFLVMFSSAVAYVQFTEPVYEAKVIMVYEKDSPTTVAVLSKIDPLAPPELDLNVQQVLLTSPIVMGEIRDRLSKENGMSELTNEEIKELLQLSSLKSSSVIELSAEGGRPYETALLANTAAAVFIEMGTQAKRAELDRAIAFLDSQMKNFDQLLEETERELARFRELEGIVPTVSKEGRVVGGLMQKLGEMQEEAILTEIEVGYTKAQLDSIRGLIANKRQNLTPDGAQGTTFTPQIETLRNRLIQIETDLFAKQQGLKDEHPDIVALKEQVAIIRAQLQGELEKLLQVTERSLDPLSEWQALLSREIQFEVEFRGLEQKKQLQEARIAQFRREHPELASQDLQLLKVERKRRLYEQSYLQMEERYTEMSLLKQMRISDMRIIREAKEKDAKVVKPKRRLSLMLGAVLGLMLGLGAAVFLEYADNTIKTEDDVKRLTGLPVIGFIPKFGHDRVKMSELLRAFPRLGDKSLNGKKRKDALRQGRQLVRLISRNLTNLPSKDPAAEAYRSIMANIRYASGGNSVKVILLASAVPGEGKSLTAANMAITFARSGNKTVLVDADLHHSRQHIILHVDRSPGFSDFCVADPEQLGEVMSSVVKQTEVENLFVVPSGKLPPNPGDLLTWPCVKTFIEYLQKGYDVILFDSPPLSAVSDASTVASYMDTSILLVRAEATKSALVQQATKALEQVGAKVFGVIINGADPKSSRYGYSYYGKYSGYYSSEP